jgi:hypothetical protein
VLKPLVAILIVSAAATSVIGCGSQPGPASPSGAASSAGVASAPPSPDATAAPSASPTVALPTPAPSRFAFSADAVLGFYAGDGFACADPQPSPGAAGWTVTTCEQTDADGRRLGVGIVRDQQGVLGDGFARVTAKAGEDVLPPEAALDHLSGFLGSMLGEDRATPLLPWLAGSMGNPYEETTDRDLRIATFLEPREDTRTIWLEVAGADYLAAPTP